VKFTQLLNRTGSTMLNTLSKEGKLRAPSKRACFGHHLSSCLGL